MRASPLLNSIKYLTLPACADCVYFRQRKLIDSSNIKRLQQECTKFGAKDLVSGLIKYEPARHCRNMKVLCGMNATYFIKKGDAVK